MTIIPSIPTTPQSWCKSPSGYVRHQALLIQLVEWLESQDIEVSIPEDTGSWDNGVDLYIMGIPVDLKSFGLQSYGSSYTWDSTYYKGRPRPLYDGSLTEWFIHPNGDDPSDWIAAPAECLRTSKYNLPPYYFQDDAISMSNLVAS